MECTSTDCAAFNVQCFGQLSLFSFPLLTWKPLFARLCAFSTYSPNFKANGGTDSFRSFGSFGHLVMHSHHTHYRHKCVHPKAGASSPESFMHSKGDSHSKAPLSFTHIQTNETNEGPNHSLFLFFARYASSFPPYSSSDCLFPTHKNLENGSEKHQQGRIICIGTFCIITFNKLFCWIVS